VTVLIEQLGLGPVSLVGHSRGGRVALLAARARPDQVRKLVLMEAALAELLLAPHGTQAHDPRHARFKATAMRFEQGDVEGGLEYFVDDVNGPGTWKRRPEEQRQLARDNAWTVVGQTGDTAVITCADIGRLKGPVLLMAGERTTRQSLDMLEAALVKFLLE
jgi:pimeloyl-ACP methyl ester carboxylesterase